MRRALDALYAAAAWLAAACMVLTLLMVLGSIVDRYVSLPVKGMDMYAGYAMAGAGFLCLAHTLKRGEHIRVTLLLSALGARGRRRLELASLAVASLLAAVFAFYSVRLVVNSLAFDDISTGNDATPLWIPQLGMAAGSVVFCIAFVDEFVLELRGRRAVREPAEMARSE